MTKGNFYLKKYSSYCICMLIFCLHILFSDFFSIWGLISLFFIFIIIISLDCESFYMLVMVCLNFLRSFYPFIKFGEKNY